MKNILKVVLGAMALMIVWPAQAQFEHEEEIHKLLTTIKIINYAYVEDVDNHKITEDAIRAMLKELDPHSAYFTKEEIKEANEPLEGNFEGIGVQFQLYKDTIMVVSPIEGGPSADVGIMAGDKIVKIDGEDATGEDITNQYVRDHLRGKKGSKVVVDIKRNGKKILIPFTIIRDKIPLYSVDAGYMINDNIGLIKISRFAKTTVDEFNEKVDILKKQGMTDLILDLRGNPGGFLHAATGLADQFLDKNKTIVYTKGRVAPRRDYNSTSKGTFKDGKLIVLINEGSASASEIVSGAVQDYGRGLIVGRRSFGKGLVQRPFDLPDSSVIRLTTSRYYTPSGRCIQKPYENGVDDYYADLKKRMEHKEHIYADSIAFPDSLKYTTITGKTVYGGGGIMPDIFIAWDSTGLTDYYTNLIKERVPNDFVMDYMEKNRKKLLKKYNSINDFKTQYQLDEAFMNDFFAFANKKEVEFDEEEYQEAKANIDALLRALIARNLFDINAYFQVISEIDETIEKSVELLEDGHAFSENKIQE